MLIELSCDDFKSSGKTRQKITFHEGLNVVVGGRRGTNSIGKSTFLMMLDFVFGGDDYTVLNIQDIKEVGPHTVKFAFQTVNGIKYFSRSTRDPYRVNVSDEHYDVKKTISIDKYRIELLDIYGISIPDTSFRDIVSSFIRVHPRVPSKLIASPLQVAAGQPRSQQIIKFEKLFNSYKEINTLKQAYDEADTKLKTLANASKYNYVSAAPNKTTVKNNSELIEKLENKVKELKADSERDVLSTDVVKNDSTRELIVQINKLKDRRGFIRSQIVAIKRNQDFKVKAKKQNYEQLRNFFPDINVEYLNQVENFHRNLAKILHKEFSDSIKKLSNQISIINQSILGLEDKVKEINQAPTINMVLIEKIGRYENEIQNLKSSNDMYYQKAKIKEKRSSIKKDWDKAVEEELHTSQKNINYEMEEMNAEVCGNRSVYPPFLNIKDGNHYTFSTSADTGTGSEYKGTILFDLACLKLSVLPFLIHDSLMFTNIELDRTENIIKLYAKQLKQVFISVDKVDELASDTQSIIKDHQVLKLGRGGDELFGRTWGLDKKKED